MYNKVVGLNGCGGGLPTYEEHLILNGSSSKQSLHHSQDGSNNRLHYMHQQQGMSHSKTSLHGQSSDFFQNQNQGHGQVQGQFQ